MGYHKCSVSIEPRSASVTADHGKVQDGSVRAEPYAETEELRRTQLSVTTTQAEHGWIGDSWSCGSSPSRYHVLHTMQVDASRR